MARRRKARAAKPIERSHPAGAWFDSAAADRVCVFFEYYLHHSKGEHAGRPFTLQAWQRDFLREAFGWKLRTGERQYKTAFVFLPKKNGKSTLAAGVALYLLLADGEMGAEVYAAAADKEQARIVFDESTSMVEGSPELAAGASAFRTSIFVPSTRSSFKPLSGRPNTKHGFNPHGMVFDELHAWKDRELYDTLALGVAARRQPFTLIITTAGYDRQSICYEQYDYACKVRDGIIEDSSFLPLIFEAGKDDDWHDPETWRKANPSYGVTITEAYFESAHRKAAETPAAQNAFRRLHLNQWTEQATRWLAMDDWAACGGEIDPAELAGEECFGALDLSSTTDLTAMAKLFPRPDGRYLLWPTFWLPGESAIKRQRQDRVPYPAWIQAGHIRQTGGNVVDYEAIRAAVNEDVRQFGVRALAYDEWNATQLASQLHEQDGVPMVPFRQGYKSMSPAAKELEKLVLSRRLVHPRNPVLDWCVSNVAITQDPAGNIKPAKDKSSGRIDGAVAAIMAVGRATVGEGGVSDYGAIVTV